MYKFIGWVKPCHKIEVLLSHLPFFFGRSGGNLHRHYWIVKFSGSVGFVNPWEAKARTYQVKPPLPKCPSELTLYFAKAEGNVYYRSRESILGIAVLKKEYRRLFVTSNPRDDSDSRLVLLETKPVERWMGWCSSLLMSECWRTFWKLYPTW